MAKTKMKRTVGRRRKSGKKTNTSTRNKKRKNVIRGGLPIKKAIVMAAALFKLFQNKPATPIIENIDTPTQQLAFIQTLDEFTLDGLVNEAKQSEESYYTQINWSDYTFDDITHPNDELTETTIDAMQRASGNTRLDRAVKHNP